MTDSNITMPSRRAIGKLALGIGVAALTERVAAALPFGSVQVLERPAAVLPAAVVPARVAPRGIVPPALMRRALAALEQHAHRVPHMDRIAIVDFAAPSSEPRMHFIHLASQQTTSLLVAHGSGSDPAHTGWLQLFSNDDGSNASSSGAYLATDYYVGKHGHSQKLIGLDATNSNALDRAIVMHSAWYANPDVLAAQGMLGRSQGCFAVGEHDLDAAFTNLGAGRMIYADKV